MKQAQKRALVMGGNRFMGRHLSTELIRRGYKLTLLNRGQVPDGLGNSVQRLHADRTDEGQLRAALGDQSWDLVFDQICFDAYVAGLACRAFSARTDRYIFISSVAVYEAGSHRAETLFDPRSYKFDRVALATEDYAEGKRQAEAVFAQKASFETAMVRLPFVIGVDDYTGRLQWHVDRVKEGKPIYFPNLDAPIAFIRSDHAGIAIADIGESQLKGPVNCAAPGSVTGRELVSLIEKFTGKTANLSGVPAHDLSPYGSRYADTMDLRLMNEHGIKVPAIETWLESLIRELC